MPKLKPETQAARKEHLLQSALACFAASGYDRTTVDDIVREAGLSKGSLYSHFESKKALYVALLEKMLADTGLIAVLNEDGRTGRQKLEAAMASMLTFTGSQAYHDYASLLMNAWTQAQSDPDVAETLASIYTRLRDAFKKLIEGSIAAGESNPVDAVALANIFIAVFDGLMVQHMLDRTSIDWRVTAATMQSSWMKGLLAEEG